MRVSIEHMIETLTRAAIRVEREACSVTCAGITEAICRYQVVVVKLGECSAEDLNDVLVRIATGVQVVEASSVECLTTRPRVGFGEVHTDDEI